MTWAAWFALGALAGTVIVVRVMRGRAHSQRADLGSLSDQWVAEHRAGQGEDSI